MADSGRMNYGQILFNLRTYHGYKQKDISNYLNITSQAYSNYERNHRTPDIEVMRKIAMFYHITLDQMLSGHYEPCLQEAGNYMTSSRKCEATVINTSLSIPITEKQAKMLTDILALPEEEQDAWHKVIAFKKPLVT